MIEYTEIELTNLIISTQQGADAWCEEYVGMYGRDETGKIEHWAVRYGPDYGDRTYIFAREQDAVMFALKWAR